MGKSTDNLVSFADMPPEKRSEIARKGAYASAEAKRKKKALRELFSDFLHSEINQEDKGVAESLGINLEEGNKALLALASCLRVATSDGNARDLEKIMNMAGEMDEDSGAGDQAKALIYLPEMDEADGSEAI